jgi:CheY-like chemotaxis protein
MAAAARPLWPVVSVAPLRVVVVDDHPSFRHAARTLLAWHGIAVVGEAAGAATALAVVADVGPDAVLLDVRLGPDDGFALACVLRRRYPHIGIVLMSSDVDRLPHSPYAHGPVEKDALCELDLGALLAPLA